MFPAPFGYPVEEDDDDDMDALDLLVILNYVPGQLYNLQIPSTYNSISLEKKNSASHDYVKPTNLLRKHK